MRQDRVWRSARMMVLLVPIVMTLVWAGAGAASAATLTVVVPVVVAAAAFPLLLWAIGRAVTATAERPLQPVTPVPGRKTAHGDIRKTG